MYLRKRLALAAALLLGAGIVVAPATAASANARGGRGETPDKVVSAYYAGWDIYLRNYHVKDIPADKLNVIQYAFGTASYDATTGTPGCGVIDGWGDYQAPQDASVSVDGVGDDSSDVNQHL